MPGTPRIWVAAALALAVALLGLAVALSPPGPARVERPTPGLPNVPPR